MDGAITFCIIQNFGVHPDHPSVSFGGVAEDETEVRCQDEDNCNIVLAHLCSVTAGVASCLICLLFRQSKAGCLHSWP